MSEKTFPLTYEQLKDVVKKFPTPFHIYDEKKIRATLRALNHAFRWAPKFRNQFAVKALPNPRIVHGLQQPRRARAVRRRRRQGRRNPLDVE